MNRTSAMAALAALAGCAGLPSGALAAGGDLAIAVSVAPGGPITVGQSVTFVVTLTNTSSSATAEDVRFDEVLPGNSSDPRQPSTGHVKWASQTYTDDPDFGCSGEPRPADSPPYGTTCTLSSRDMAAGETLSLTIVGRADRAGQAINYAGATSYHYAYDPATNTTGPVFDDPNQTNNASETKFEIVEPAPAVSRGDARDNTLPGGPGPDAMFGGGGDDILRGFGGNDHLDGGAGNDTLIGGPGNDVIKGGAGKDAISGGSGRDAVDSADGVRETVDCGSGKDTVKADSSDRLRGCEIRHLRRGRTAHRVRFAPRVW